MSTDVHRNPLTLYQRLLQTVLMRVRPAPLAVHLKRALGTGRTVVATPSGKFWIDPVSLLGMALSRRGEHEPAMHETIERWLPSGGVFVDLGANEGYFSVLGALRCGANGRVLAIEPQQRLLPVITRNAELNGVGWVEILNVAVADVQGSAAVHLTADTSSGGSGLHANTRYRLPTQSIETRTLCQVLDDAGLARVDLMKVDIEGFEYEALLGSTEVFATHRVRALALELHPELLAKRGKAANDITAMLATSGYTASAGNGNAVWLAPGVS